MPTQGRPDPLRRNARKKRRSPKPQPRREPQHRLILAAPPAQQTRPTVPLRLRWRARQRPPRVQNRLLPRLKPISGRLFAKPPTSNIGTKGATAPPAQATRAAITAKQGLPVALRHGVTKQAATLAVVVLETVALCRVVEGAKALGGRRPRAQGVAVASCFLEGVGEGAPSATVRLATAAHVSAVVAGEAATAPYNRRRQKTFARPLRQTDIAASTRQTEKPATSTASFGENLAAV